MAIAESNGTEIAISAGPEQLALIDNIVAECSIEALADVGHFAKALKFASGMRMLSRALTNEMLQDVMLLQGKSLGFRTDKDKSGGYDIDTVKVCFMEALMVGAYPVGNEFNIIADRTYLTKEYFTRKVKQFPGLTDLNLQPAVPQLMGEKGALVAFLVTWRLHGKPCKLEKTLRKLEDGSTVDERIPVKVNAGMGSDAIIGKATRKMLKAVYEQLTGIITLGDGDAEDSGPALRGPSNMDQLADKLAKPAIDVKSEPAKPQEPASTSETPNGSPPAIDFTALVRGLADATTFAECDRLTRDALADNSPLDDVTRDEIVELLRLAKERIKATGPKGGK